MAKAKQKFRKAVGRARAKRFAQALALAGLIASCVPAPVQALELNTSPSWSVNGSLAGLLLPENVIMTGGGASSVVTSQGNHLGGRIGALTVTGNAITGATLNISSNIVTTAGLLSNGLVTVSGVTNKGILNITQGNTLTAGGLVTVNGLGVLDVAGTLKALQGVAVNTGGQITLRAGSSLNFGTGAGLVLTGGTLLFSGVDGSTVGNGVLNADMNLKSGNVQANTLSFAGFAGSINIAASGGALNVTANQLALDSKSLYVGSTISNAATTVTINGTIAGATLTEFLGGNVNVVGNLATQTLQLGSVGYTGTSNSTSTIFINGSNGAQALADKAKLNVDYGRFSVDTVEIGSSNALSAGTLTVNNAGRLDVTNRLNVYGGAGQAGVVKFGPLGGVANIIMVKTLTVGTGTAYGVVDMASNVGRLIVDTANAGSLTVGSKGQLNVNNADSILEFTGNFTLDSNVLSTSGSAANGKIWLNNGKLIVGGTLSTTANQSTFLNGQNIVGVDTTAGAVNATAGVLNFNAGKTTTILGMNNGNLLTGTVQVQGGASADTLVIGQNGVSMNAGSQSQGEIKLLGAVGKAVLAVTGNGIGNSIYQLKSLEAGGDVGVGGASVNTGSISVNNATLKVGTLALLGGSSTGAAAMIVGNIAAAEVIADSLIVGNAYDKGRLTLRSGASLSTSALNFHTTNGSIFLDIDSVLNLYGNATLLGEDLTKGTALQQGSITMNNKAAINVTNVLTLTGAGPISVDIGAAKVNAKGLYATNSGAPAALTLNGGIFTLYGAGGASPDALQAASLSITGGALQLGGPDMYAGGTKLTTLGSKYIGSATVSGTGALNVVKGNWSFTNTTTGLTVSAANGLKVTDSYFGVGKLTTMGSGTAEVGAGPGLSRLAIIGGPNNLATVGGSINVYSNGVFEASDSMVISGLDLKSGVGKFDVGLGGTLTLVGNRTITQTEYNTLKGNLINGAGSLNLLGYTITPDVSRKLMDVKGTSLPALIALAYNNDNVNLSTTVKGLEGDLKTSDIDVIVSSQELRLVGESSLGANFKLSDNGAFKTNFTVNNTALLTFGNPAGLGKTYGTLAGDVTLASGGGLNAVLGEFGAGSVSGAGNVNVSFATLKLASLTLSAAGTVTVNQMGVLQSDSDSTVFNLALDNGTFITADGASPPATGKNLNVTGAISMINSSLLHVGKDLSLTGTVGTLSDSRIEVLGNLTATGKNIIGSNLNMAVGSLLAAASLTADNTSTYQLGDLAATGQTKVDHASSLTVNNQLTTVGLTVDNGSTVTAKSNADTGSLSIGTTAASIMKVTGNLDSSSVSLVKGSQLDVGGTLTASSTATIDNASTLISTGKLTAVGLTVNNGATVTAKADAETGALFIGANAASVMTVAGKLTTSTVSVQNGATLSVVGDMESTSTASVNNVGSAITVGGNFEAAGLTMDNGALLTAQRDAVISGALSIGPNAKSVMTVAQSLNVTGSATLSHASTLDVTGNFTANSTTLDRGAVLTANADADTGDLTIGATATAAMTVVGTLDAGAVNMSNGSTLAVTGDMTSSGALSLLDKGAALTAKSLTLAGAGTASLTVGGAGMASVKVKDLAIGDGSQQGRLTVANGSVTTETLNNTANGGVLLKAAGVMNVLGDLTMAGQNLVSSTTIQQGKVALDGGSLNIAGALALTGSGSVSTGLTSAASGLIRAKTVTTANTAAGDTPTSLAWSGDELVLYGTGGAFTNATQLDVTGGKVRLGGDDYAVGSATLSTLGGSYLGPINVSNTGTFEVYKGAWELGDVNVTAANVPNSGGGLLMSGGTLTAGTVAVSGVGNALISDGTTTATQISLSGTGSLTITGGIVNTAGLSTVNTATATIGGGTSNAYLNLTGGAGSLSNIANSIGILNHGFFTAAFSSVASGDSPLGTVGTFDVDTGGRLTLTGLASITLADYDTLRGQLVNGSGLLDLGATVITDVPATLTLAAAEGKSFPDVVVLASDGSTVNGSTTVKGITIDPTGTADATLNVDTGELRLVGDKIDHDFSLVDNGSKQTNINVGQNGSLGLGNPTGDVPTYGILDGNIALDGQLKADNGTFTVGDVIGSANATGVTVNDATLNTGALDLSLSPNSVVTVNNGTLSASKDSTVYDVNLDRGTLTSTGTADLTVNGTATLVNNSTLAAGGDLTFTGTKPPASPADPILNGKDSTVTAGGNLDASNRNITGDNLDIIVGGILNVADLTGINGSHYVANSLQALDDVTLDNGATLTTVADASVGGILTLGQTAAAEMAVGGVLDADSVILDNGSKLNVTKDMYVTDVMVMDASSSVIVGGKLTSNDLVTIKGNATLVVDSLDVPGASYDVVVDSGAVLTTTKNADIGGILSVGTTAAAQVRMGGNLTASKIILDHASMVNVVGNMTTTGETTLNGGSIATVGGSFSANGTVAVLDDSILNVDTFIMKGHDVVVGEAVATGDSAGTGGTLIANTLNTTAGGQLLLESESDKAFVGATDLTDKQFTAMAVVSKNGILSLGNKDRVSVDALINASGVTPSSVLLVSTPMTVGTAGSKGQILVGENYHTGNGVEGMWAANTTVDPYALALRGNSLLVADMGKVPAGSALITLGMAPTSNSVLIEKSAAIRLIMDSGLKGDATYDIVSGIGSLYQQEGGTAMSEGQTLTLNGPLATNNVLVSISDLTYRSGKLEATTTASKSTSTLPGLSGGMGEILDNLALTGFDVNHSSAGTRFLSRATDSRYINGLAESTRTIESAARISAAGAVQGMTMGVADGVRSTLENRTNSLGHVHNKSMGISSSEDGTWVVEDGTLRPGVGLWFTPLYRAERVSGMKSGGLKTGYTGDFGGATVGADYTAITGENVVRVGAAFNVGGGKAHSTGDFHRTNNDFDFWGLNLYGRWNYDVFSLRGDLGYISSDNSLKQDLPSSLSMEHLKSKVSSSAMMAGLTAEYRFITAFANVLPYAGVRYTGLNTGSHDTKSGGETVFHTAKENQNIVSFPMGVAVEKTWEMDNGWMVKPSLDLGVIPAVGDLSANHKVSVTGVSGTASLNTRVLDRMTFAGGLGLQIKNDTVSMGLDYNILASQHRTSHGAAMTFRMTF